LRTSNAKESVYESLRKNILHLNLLPGVTISENEISQRFNTSRTPVREAFIALSKEALVTIVPQKTSMVSLIDFNRVRQEIFLRENLEMAALVQFVKNHEAAHLLELERFIQLQSAACENRNVENFLHYDNMFHRVFFYNQSVAWEASENMCGHYYRVRLLTLRLLEIEKDRIDEHIQIFNAVKKKDKKKACSNLKIHLHKLNTEEATLKRMFPDYFVDTAKNSLLPKHIADVNFC
jgi:DNA-binding GntR family transcriptional regulator